jgi:hypothetical protein
MLLFCEYRLARAIRSLVLRADRDGFRHVLERQHDDVLVVAAVQPDLVQQANVEPWKLRFH